MKLTLLDMVQSILSAIDSDEVNSIDDTVEAVQVAQLVKEAYFDLLGHRDWPFLRGLYSLNGLADLTRPTTMQMPEELNKVYWIKYNKKEVVYVEPDVFIDMLHNRTEQASVTDSNGYNLNADPSYWTSYNDTEIVFDSIDKSADSTLQASKTVVFGVKAPTWTHTDTFIPTLPEKMFPTLLAEAKSQAFVNLKQQVNAREERKAQKGKVVFQNEAWRNENGEIRYNKLVNYGRR